jgi:predicted ATPase
MKLKEIKLQNYRSYCEETCIPVDDLTVIVGRNDAGKSTVLEALDVFFNNANLEKEDACVRGDARNVRITCVFCDLPEELILDEQHPTTLGDEYLLRGDGCLEVCRVYDCSSAKGKQTKIFARADHPTGDAYSDLHSLKITPLKARARDLGVDLANVNETIKTDIRKAIWENAEDLRLEPSEIDLSAETGKAAWDQIELHLPVYALFKSDRASTDQDGEAQDPMKAAIKEVVRNHEQQLNQIVGQVKAELERVARKTVEKIQEMSPDLASTLDPIVKNKNWDSLFTVTLTGDEGISINKRGSGTRRLVLLNFFRAKAEDAASARSTGVIYAIEEPETSQHPNHQIMLLDAFQELSESGKAQIILTTHTPTLARKVDRNLLRFVTKEDGKPVVKHGSDDVTLSAIKETLGVLADHDVKVFVGVEGKWDIQFLKRISKLLHLSDASIPDLNVCEAQGSLVFIPLGGSSLELWTNRLAGFDRPEIYITDRDNAPPLHPKYDAQLTEWNQRSNCTGLCTTKRELENYLHPDAIRAIAPTFPNTIDDFDDVPLMTAEALHTANPQAPPWDQVDAHRRKEKSSLAKRRLNVDAANAMTLAMLQTSDPNGEIESWLRQIATSLNG